MSEIRGQSQREEESERVRLEVTERRESEVHVCGCVYDSYSRLTYYGDIVVGVEVEARSEADGDVGVPLGARWVHEQLHVRDGTPPRDIRRLINHPCREENKTVKTNM